MIKLNQKGWWLCLLSTAIVIVICGSDSLNEDEPEAYTKTITAINSETGEPMDGCRWRNEDDWIEESASSITRTKEIGHSTVYVVKKGDWYGAKKVTFNNSKSEKIMIKRYSQNIK